MAKENEAALQATVNGDDTLTRSLRCRPEGSLLNHYGEFLGLDSKFLIILRPVSLWRLWLKLGRNSITQGAVVMFVVQADERNMYDQHWHSAPLKEIHNVSTLRKTLAEIDAEGELLPDGTLAVGGQAIAVVLHTK